MFIYNNKLLFVGNVSKVCFYLSYRCVSGIAIYSYILVSRQIVWEIFYLILLNHVKNGGYVFPVDISTHL